MTNLNKASLQDNQNKNVALEHYLSWLSEILEQPVSPNDNFLDIGGHSMIAISLNERMKKEFDLVLSMKHLYNATLEDAFSAA